MNPTALSLRAGCELFLRYTTRTSKLELSEFATAKASLIEVWSDAVHVQQSKPRRRLSVDMFGLWPLPALQRGMRFAETSTRARVTIAELGSRFLHNNCVVLTHGYSRVVLALLQRAVAQVGICDGLTGSACVCSALTLCPVLAAQVHRPFPSP